MQHSTWTVWNLWTCIPFHPNCGATGLGGVGRPYGSRMEPNWVKQIAGWDPIAQIQANQHMALPRHRPVGVVHSTQSLGLLSINSAECGGGEGWDSLIATSSHPIITRQSSLQMKLKLWMANPENLDLWRHQATGSKCSKHHPTPELSSKFQCISSFNQFQWVYAL